MRSDSCRTGQRLACGRDTLGPPRRRLSPKSSAQGGDSRDYAGRLPPDVAARIIATSKGDRGTGRDYLANTVRHLEQLGIHDGALHRIEQLVAALG